MVWSFGGFRGSNNNKTSSAVIAVSPSQTIPIGAIVRAVCTSDNTATGGGVTNNHIVCDNQGNIWTKIREQSNAAAAAAGITHSEWVSQLTTALTTADSVALVLTAAAAAKAIGIYEYGVGAGNFFRIAGRNGSQQDATADPTVTLNTLASGAYALWGSVAREEDNATTYTMDADYNDRTKFGTTGSTGNTNVSCIVGDRLATLTGDTFNPSGMSIAADVTTILAALKEVVPVRITCTDIQSAGGKLYVRFGKTELAFDSLAEADKYAEFGLSQGLEILQRLFVKRYRALDPPGTDPTIMEGHSIAFTSELNEVVKVF